jgi:chromosome segregation ATPase
VDNDGARRTLRELMDAAGYTSQAALAQQAGLAPYEISRILSATAPRRPTPLQLRKLAAALKVDAEIVALALGHRGRTDESAAELDTLVEQLTREMSELRHELTVKAAKLAGAEQALTTLTRDAGALHDEREHLRLALETSTQQRASLETRLRAVNDERHRVETALAEATRRLGEIEALLKDAREQAASDMARLLGEIQGLRAHMDGGRFIEISQSIFSGQFGNRVRALLAGESEESFTTKWARRGQEIQQQVREAARDPEAEPVRSAGEPSRENETNR